MPAAATMSIRHHLALLPLLAATLAGCSPHVEGNGIYAERHFDVGALQPFDQAAIGLADVKEGEPLKASILVAPSLPRQVVLSGDENLIQHFEVRVDAGVLRVTTDLDGYTAVHPPQLRIQIQALAGVEALGGASVTVLGASASPFAVTAVAHGHVALTGVGETLRAVLSGGAELEAAGFQAISAELSLTGASRATVSASGQLSGHAEGGSRILVTGGATCPPDLVDASSTCGPL